MFNFYLSTLSTLLMVVFFKGTPLSDNKTGPNDLVYMETISYDVLRKNSSVGFITLEKQVFRDKMIITAKSQVNARFILNFKAIGSDKCIYQDNRLVYSSQFRKINNKVRVDQSISYHEGNYIFKENEKESILNIQSIEFNIIPLFFSEPKNINQVYSDKFRKMVNVEYLGANVYRVVLPNGEESTYYYQDGKCNYIDVVGTFFNVRLVKSK